MEFILRNQTFFEKKDRNESTLISTFGLTYLFKITFCLMMFKRMN